jgi:hypothetical protein
MAKIVESDVLQARPVALCNLLPGKQRRKTALGPQFMPLRYHNLAFLLADQIA